MSDGPNIQFKPAYKQQPGAIENGPDAAEELLDDLIEARDRAARIEILREALDQREGSREALKATIDSLIEGMPDPEAAGRRLLMLAFHFRTPRGPKSMAELGVALNLSKSTARRLKRTANFSEFIGEIVRCWTGRGQG